MSAIGRKLSFTEAVGNGGYVPIPVGNWQNKIGTKRQIFTTRCAP